MNSDMALDQDDTGTKFVMLVVIMMSILATMATGGALIVKGLRAGWVDAVNGHMTIEIPASDSKGMVRGSDLLDDVSIKINDAVSKDPAIADIHVMREDDIKKLVAPWLGADAGTTDLPLPRLIALTLKNPGDDNAIARISQTVRSIDASSITETHQAWLSDLKRFSLALLLAASAMAAATIGCTILTVTGAVKARLAAHQHDIDLLHVMGATDSYIGSQFVRVVVRSVGSAALTGMIIGIGLLKAGGMVAGGMGDAGLPDFNWDFGALLWFAALPCLITGLCWLAAQFTVLRTLRVMP